MPCRSIRPISATAMAAVTLVMVGSLSVVAEQCAAQPPRTQVPSSASRPVAEAPLTSRPTVQTGLSTRELRAAAVSAVPLDRLTATARQRIGEIVDRPTLYRHLPTQKLTCDPELFLFIVRHPEVLVGIWEEMGITQVRTKRIDEYRLDARDGSGTNCMIDLVYGDRSMHVYVADGYYDGKLVAAPLTGKGVFILRTRNQVEPDGLVTIEGTLDCFIQLDNLGADLIARTFGPLIGKTADNNFAETAKFIEQVGLTARKNPDGFIDLASRLPQVDESVRRKMIEVIVNVDRRNQERLESRAIARSTEESDDVLKFR
jgi:hypothetical protein